MLVALDALGNATTGVTLSSHVVFAALVGDVWDNMGSKRLVWEMQQGANSTWGWKMEDVKQAIEVGAVGLMHSGEGDGKLYMHYHRSEQYDKPSVLMDALREAAESTPEVSVLESAASNPGLPPSSLPSFLRVKPNLPAVVLAEYDSAFINKYYNSRFDDESNVDMGAMAAAAEVLSRVLFNLAGGGAAGEMPLDRDNLRGMVEGLVDCLVKEAGGLRCWLSAGMFDASESLPLHRYTGVLTTQSSDSQDPRPNVKKPVERFLWRYMADRTQTGQGTLESGGEGPCDYLKNKCAPDSVCIGHNYTTASSGPTGHCVRATVRYVPSFSTHFSCIGCHGTEGFGNWSIVSDAGEWEAAGSWPADSMWTESMWPMGIPALTLYLRESSYVEWMALVAGGALTAGAAGVVIGLRLYLEWQKKTL